MQPLVVVIGYEGLATFEFAIVTEIFGISRPELMPDWYSFALCAVEPGSMRTSGGFEVRIEDPWHCWRRRTPSSSPAGARRTTRCPSS